jgi:glutathione peroxidase
MFDKVNVKSSPKHALYEALTGPASSAPGDVKWNFAKFVIGKDGKLVKRFDSGTAPESEELGKVIADALAAK